MKKRGNQHQKIAEDVGCHRNTVTRILQEPVNKEFVTANRLSAIDKYRSKIEKWISEKVPVSRMCQLAQEDAEQPYTGGKSAFYARVKTIRTEMGKTGGTISIGFDGLPGEFLQIDWGEAQIPFELVPRGNRYFFCARLKYSRTLYVEVHQNMQSETLLRCLLRSFEALGGIPWCLVFDNMKTVTTGRDDQHQPIWNETFLKFSAEMDFHPIACWMHSPQQKGTVENLVKLVKSDFLSGRVFLDDEDLTRQCREWVERTNSQPCQATERCPNELLEEERTRMSPLRETAEEYGMYQACNVSRNESMITLDTNRYSVPEQYAGRNVTVRIHPGRIRIYADAEMIADHPRCIGRKERIRVPEHFEKTLSRKPRARVMLYREQLLKLSPESYQYVAELCRRNRQTMNREILRLHELWKEHDTANLLSALELAMESGVFGCSYLEHILAIPAGEWKILPLRLTGIPAQMEVDRNLAEYDRYVH